MSLSSCTVVASTDSMFLIPVYQQTSNVVHDNFNKHFTLSTTALLAWSSSSSDELHMLLPSSESSLLKSVNAACFDLMLTNCLIILVRGQCVG